MVYPFHIAQPSKNKNKLFWTNYSFSSDHC